VPLRSHVSSTASFEDSFHSVTARRSVLLLPKLQIVNDPNIPAKLLISKKQCECQLEFLLSHFVVIIAAVVV